MANLCTIKEVNLEELMEVMTSYKCKFCDYVCTSISEMSDHLNHMHVVRQVVTTDMVNETSATTSELEASVKSENPDVTCDDDNSLNVNQENSAETFASPALLSSAGIVVSSASNPAVTSQSYLPDPNVLTNQVRCATKNIPMNATSHSEQELFSDAPSSATVVKKVPMVGVQLSGSGLTMTTTTAASCVPHGLSLTSTTIDTITLPSFSSTKDLGTGPASIVPLAAPLTTTREFFLCGSCSLGFVSMEECRLHMAQEHNAMVPQGGSISDTIIDRMEQRVSIGTQATGKRPGRKRKSEISSQSLTVGRKKASDEEDADWLPGRGLSSSGRDGQQRRRIRAPRALTQDYVIEPKRKYRKRQLISQESYTWSCSYVGCSTRFRFKGALEIHTNCHNQEDDAFTCLQCNSRFSIWKPLRIHLWRVHNVDCDMFECDLCKYKTDTIHKLAVHREIHSENRPYTCDLCGKGFKQLSQMKNHQIIHTDQRRSERALWFSSRTCETCKRTFANSKCLKKHVEAVHGHSKPFKCTYCNHTTAWKAMLILHERTHTGEKPFKCDICPYATGDHNSLRRHKMRHSGKKQYQCQLCPYTCIQTISLKMHMRNKHPHAKGIVYICPKCKFVTINKLIYDNHLKDHVNGLIPQTKLDSDEIGAAQPILYSDVSSAQSSDSTTVKGPAQFQLEVKWTEAGELHANKEDIDHLNSMPEFANIDMDANQLIYSALSINLGPGKETLSLQGLAYTAQLSNGVHCTVSPTRGLPGKGVAFSYLITFLAPTSVPVAMTESLTRDLVGGAEDQSLAMPDNQEQEGIQVLDAAPSGSVNFPSSHMALYTETTRSLEVEGSSSLENQHALSVSSSTSDFSVVQAAAEDETDAQDLVKILPVGLNTVEGDMEMRVVDCSEQDLIVGKQVMLIENGQMVQRLVVMASDGQGNSLSLEVDESDKARDFVNAQSVTIDGGVGIGSADNGEGLKRGLEEVFHSGLPVAQE